jgi:hypothetical protein
MAKKKKAAAKKPAKKKSGGAVVIAAREPRIVKYKELSTGRTWEAKEGEPNGCFALPGKEGEIFSLESLVNFIAKNVSRVTVVNENQAIEGPFPVTFNDGLALMGLAPAEQPKKAIGSTKTASTASAPMPLEKMLDDAIAKIGKTTYTKADLTGAGGLTDHYVKKMVESGELQEAGREGNFKLYTKG